MRVTKVPLGLVAVTPTGRRFRCANLAAGECGVKDQVSRTQPNAVGIVNDTAGLRGTGRIVHP